jgi:uncharacterized membrane protein
MGIGTRTTRWEDAAAAIRAATANLSQRDALASVHLYRFGHRLAAIEAEAGGERSGVGGQRSEVRGQGSDVGGRKSEPLRQSLSTLDSPPTDTDTRLAEALRQLTSRFGRTPPAAVVLFSDGRVRDAQAVEELARHYGDKRVPVHAYPVGDTASGGDVALVSVVAPQQVRKFSTVDVQVFLRSFGYEGRRAEVKVVALDAAGGPPTELQSVPITLRGGVQPVPLTYRSDMHSQQLRVMVGDVPDEISTRNNMLAADVAIDRTKIRVLYIEGSEDPITAVRRGDQYEWVGPHSTLQEALTEDEDVECVTMVRLSGATSLLRIQSLQTAAGARGFPDTQAELAAFDAVILSNVSRTAFTDEQLAWIDNWVNSRGGGLCMLGGPGSFATGGWEDTPIADMLPVSIVDERWSPADQVAVLPDTIATSHSLWNILADRQRNRDILREVPGFLGLHRGLVPKPACDVLASAQAGDTVPLVVSGKYGRGRTLAMSVPATAPPATQFLNQWGASGNQYAAKFWRNLVYWLTENSAIGRRRLVAAVDKQFYRPGETIALSAVAYDETARRTTDYSLWAMIEPRSLNFDEESLYSSVRWPNGVPRESGEDGPYVAWGEEFELPRNSETGEYGLPVEIAEKLRAGTDNQGLRIELTAYENTGASLGFSRGTQVDSTSLDIQIIDDPFEQQNPFPNHDLLARVASLSDGKVLASPAQLAEIVDDLPVEHAPPVVRKVPLWSRWWLLGLLLGLLSAEWFWRRSVGLA